MPYADYFWNDGETKSKATGLMAAAFYELNDVARALIHHEANFIARNKDGFTVLMFAAVAGHNYLLRLLIDLGADVNGKDKGKRTPLICAVWAGHYDTPHPFLFSAGPTSTGPMKFMDGMRWSLQLNKDTKGLQSFSKETARDEMTEQ